MSLIHQMLQDLEQRKSTDGQVSPTDALPWMQPKPSRAATWGPKIIGALIATGLAVFAVSHINARVHEIRLRPAITNHESALAHTQPTQHQAFKPLQANTIAGLSAPVELNTPLVSFQPLLDKTMHLSLAQGLLKPLTNKPMHFAMPKNEVTASSEQPTQPLANQNQVISEVQDNTQDKTRDSSQLKIEAGTPRNETANLAEKKPLDKTQFSKHSSPEQQAINEYQQAIAMIQQGRVNEAHEKLNLVLSLNPLYHEARQVLVGILVEMHRPTEAIVLLKQGISLAPNHSAFALTLARLQMNAKQLEDALVTLEKGLPYAVDDGAYHGFMAALLQRAERHTEAIVHFQVAIQHGAEAPALWVGYAVSLQAEGRTQEAIQAYQQAKAGLADGDLKIFVAQKLKQLTQSIQAQR